ncbi:MAG: 4-hydroxybenzoate octaprenyltransferase [Rhodospirillales bacterium]
MAAQPVQPPKPPPAPHTDIAEGGLLTRFAPAWVLPYARLARWDRPIGWYLLFLPCAFGWALAGPFAASLAPGAAAAAGAGAWPVWAALALFAFGAFAMRGAGCTVNDMADRDFDRAVERTAARPLASGALSMTQAGVFLAVQAAAGLAVLLQFNTFTVVLGLASLPLIAFYPFAKRVTHWPQAVLGLTFNWGALMGWAAVHGGLGPVPAAPLALYAGCVFWTLGYDTIYAHQDKTDDAIVGVRSTALLFGARTQAWVFGFYAAAAACWAGAGWAAGMGPLFYAGLAVCAAHLWRQALRTDFDNPAACLRAFKANRTSGLILFTALMLGQV